MSTLYICIFSALILQSFITVNCLECRYCSSTDRNSPCRLGTETKTKTCDPGEGDDSCYEEYIMGQKNTDVPLYRRGCASKNWCDIQKGNHGIALKDCNTCQEDKCNKDIFGSESSAKVCRSCTSLSTQSQCRGGGIDLEKMTCRADQICAYSLVSTARKDVYKRECASKDYCNEMKNEYGHSLAACKICEDDLCNNIPMPISV